MEYLITFLEGIITFISPCLLPMLPIYLSYFSGSDNLSTSKSSAKNALGFIVGFTIAFVSLGAFAGILGSWLLQYQTLLHIISGGIVILFGLSFCGIFHFPLRKEFVEISKSADLVLFRPCCLALFLLLVGHRALELFWDLLCCWLLSRHQPSKAFCYYYAIQRVWVFHFC